MVGVVVVGGAVVVTGFVVVGAAVVVTGFVVVGGAVVVTGFVVVGEAVVVVTGAVVLAVGGLETVVFVVPHHPVCCRDFRLRPSRPAAPACWAANEGSVGGADSRRPAQAGLPAGRAQASASAHQIPVASTSNTAAQRRGCAFRNDPRRRHLPGPLSQRFQATCPLLRRPMVGLETARKREKTQRICDVFGVTGTGNTGKILNL